MSSNIYQRIYVNLCVRGKQLKEKYVPGSNLHRHHIIPRHSGGTDDEENLTYLTVREHIIAHFLLWKIHKNPNDLRSMNMLGANITSKQRKIIGEWCRDNKIGFHSYDYEHKSAWGKKGLESQKRSGNKNSFYWWSTSEGRKERASMGGKASMESGNNEAFAYWSTSEGRKERASMGGKAHKGKKAMHKPGDSTFIRVLPENVENKIKEGYVLGSPLKPRLDSTSKKPHPNRKKVTDGKVVYDSVEMAAKSENVSRSAITSRCKSKKSSWSFV